MILCFDIGNTNIRCAFFNSDGNIHALYSSPTDKNRSADDYVQLIDKWINDADSGRIKGVIFSSVVPQVNKPFTDAVLSRCKITPVAVTDKIILNFTINYDDPAKLGADRIANAAAAFAKHRDKNIIVIDIGTAMTLCVLLSEHIFDGGIITPGFGVAMESLSANTAQLFNVEVRRPAAIAAHNTHDAIQSGIFYGWPSMIEGLLARIFKSYDREFIVILTGGASALISDEIKHIHEYEKDLTMNGLYILYKLNLKN